MLSVQVLRAAGLWYNQRAPGATERAARREPGGSWLSLYWL